MAQLKYQDPMKPMDNTEFLAQTAQFTTVEKLSEIAKQNDSMIQAQTLLGASSLVGRTVSYLGEDGVTVTGQVSSVRLDAKDGTTVRIGSTDIPVTRITDIRTTPATGTSDSSTTPAADGSAPSGTSA